MENSTNKREGITTLLGGEIPQIPQVDSFQDQIKQTEQVDFFYNLRNNALTQFQKKSKDNLELFDINSTDKVIIDNMNEDINHKDLITEFNSTKIDEVIGTRTSKKLIVEMINIIKEPKFQESENGKLIYDAYRELVKNSNINALELEENKKSWFRGINSGLYNCVKWTLAGNKMVAGFQITMYALGFSVATKMVLPIIVGSIANITFSDREPISIKSSSETKKEDSLVIENSGTDYNFSKDFKDDEGGETFSKAFGEFLMKIAKMLIEKGSKN